MRYFKKSLVVIFLSVVLVGMFHAASADAVPIGASDNGAYVPAPQLTQSAYQAPTSIPQVPLATAGGSPTVGSTPPPMDNTQPNFFEKLLGDLVSALPNLIIHVLFLKDITQLVFPSDGSIWGVFSAGDYRNVITPLYLAFSGLAWSIVLFIIYTSAIGMARAGANSSKRIKMYALLENWIVGAILLAGTIPLINIFFDIALKINAILRPPGSIHFLNFSGSAGNTLASILIMPLVQLVIIGATFALNFIYIQRYFVLMIFTAMSPLYCATWFSDKTRHIFNNWWKEMLANIFMPVSHALFLWIYQVSGQYGSANPVEQMFFLILLIPMSDMIRQMIGAGGGGKGLNNALLLGVGMGASVGLMRNMIGLGEAVSGSQGVQGMLAGGVLSGGSKSAFGGGGGRVSGSGAPAPLGGAEVPNVGQVMSNNAKTQGLAARVGAARAIGSKVAGAYGAVGGALLGAATGNGQAAAIGGLVGGRVGAQAGHAMSGRAALMPSTIQRMKDPEKFHSELGELNVPEGTVPNITPEVQQAFGEANFASLKAMAAGGTVGGGQHIRNAVEANHAAVAAGRTMYPNPENIKYSEGDTLRAVTTDTGTHVMRVNPGQPAEPLYVTGDTNPYASTSTPYVREFKMVNDNGQLVAKPTGNQGMMNIQNPKIGTRPGVFD